MQKLIGGILATTSLAFQQHPFTGENRNADIVEHENGTSHRADRIRADPHRYEELRNKESYSVRSHENKLNEYLFGESEEVASLKSDIKRYFNKKNSRQHRLREVQVETEEVEDYIYGLRMKPALSATINMVADTTTRMIALDKNAYDIEASAQ